MTSKEVKAAGSVRMGKRPNKAPSKPMTPSMASKIRKKAGDIMQGKGSSAGAAY